MGYDFFLRQAPIDLPERYEPQYPGQPEYFRLSSSGMAAMFDVMHRAEIFDVQISRPDMSWPPPTLPEERADELSAWFFNQLSPDVLPTAEELPALEPIRQHILQAQSTPSPLSARVPAFKFCSNDGWLVTPSECAVIASALHAGVQRSRQRFGLFRGILPSKRETGASLSESRAWVLSWAGYNTLAARHGGYQVL